MVELYSVSKLFDGYVAVDNISLRVQKGEIIGFLGPNGAGKTTTMRMILGFLQPSSGHVIVHDKSPTSSRIEVLKHIGYLPENNPLYTDMKVKDYLHFIAEVKSVTDKAYMHIAKDVGLEEKLNDRIEELSRGYKQRVGLVAALIGNPSILILDEPTSGLDPIEQDNIKDLIKKVAADKIVIFSTHIMTEAEDIANRLIIINKGHIVYDGNKPKEKGGVELLFRDVIKKHTYDKSAI